MSLKITITSKHTLHLINRYTHIEVYFTGPTQHCPLVRKLLTTAIDNSSDAMHLKHNYVNAFACPNNESCYCIVNEDHHRVADCTVCGQSPDISNDYWTWFNDAQGPDESNNGTQIEKDNDQSLNKIKKKLEIVLRENQVTLHDIFMETQDTLKGIARALNAVNIVDKAVQKEPTYESIIGSFINGMKLKDNYSDIEEHCVKFLTALSGVGGPVAEASDMIKKKWMSICTTVGLNITFEGNASKMDDMPSAANAVQMKGHASDENLLLDKKPEKSDLLRLFKSSAAHYMIIGTALDVEVDDLSHNPEVTTINLIKVFKKWLHSNNDVTWRNIVQVCEDYPDELERAKANVQEFLLSDRAHAKYLK
ncbi:PREDICTED: uncharacterized protein LOC109592121 [Amphimedon queenslandica]|uniref:Death domain-containing protein n=1 Tax=Amphimedon queenslandica TaxID=400682 RepID=A0A1X7SP81_AMPQE|nr:PREDICTED: uncharacterized protein LOC109592121 [Amphimedon queenslandica]|eukprot:XP_019863221.1 PREDICTED: uncharacterized protein LOC109592121 [Amphimedon queenslandica]